MDHALRLPVRFLQAEQALPFPVFKRAGASSHRWRNAGELIRASDLKRLSDQGIAHLFVDSKAQAAFGRYLLGRVQHIQTDTTGNHEQLGPLIIAAGNAILSDFEHRPEAIEAFHLCRLWVSTVTSLLADSNLGLKIISHFCSECRDRHGVRTAVWVGVLSGRLGLASASRRDMIEAGLFHDLGTALLDHKAVPDAGAEYEHARLTLELLKSHSSLRHNVFHAISAHHERIDGGGYPFGLKGEDVEWSARVLGLIDAIDEAWSAHKGSKCWLTTTQTVKSQAPYGFETDMVEQMISLCTMST